MKGGAYLWTSRRGGAYLWTSRWCGGLGAPCSGCWCSLEIEPVELVLTVSAMRLVARVRVLCRLVVHSEV